MPPPSLRLGAALLLASLCAGQEQSPDYFELDVIFPRNETYTASSAFPIAFAIQNLTAARLMGDFKFSWDIVPLSEGESSNTTGDVVDHGSIDGPTPEGEGEDETFIYIGNSNVTDWIQQKRRWDKYLLVWHIRWNDVEEPCGSGVFHGNMVFSIEAPWEKDGEDWPQAGQGVAPDVTEVPECPILGSVVEIHLNAIDMSCPAVWGESTREGNPCAVVVDKGLASSIAREAADLAMPTTTPTGEAQPTEGAASDVSPSIQVRTILAAACVVLGFL